MFVYYYFHHMLVLAAIIPAVFLLVRSYRSDRLEKESYGIIAMLLIGGIASTLIAAFLERIGHGILSLIFEENSLLYRVLMYLLVKTMSAHDQYIL